MSADEIRNTIENDGPQIVKAYGSAYACGWRAALEWTARKMEEGEQK